MGNRWSAQTVVLLGFGLTLIVLIFGGVSGSLNVRRLSENEARVTHSHAIITELETLSSTVKDAETGQRGYLLVGDLEYLKPYEEALRQVHGTFARLKALTADDPDRQARLRELKEKLDLRLAELTGTVALMKAGNQAAALMVVRQGTGNSLMADLRDAITQMRSAEEERLQVRAELAHASYRRMIWSISLGTILGVVLLGVVFVLDRRNLSMRRKTTEIIAEQKERLRVTLASIGDAVLTTDAAGRVTYLNDVAINLTGWTCEAARDQPVEAIFNIVNEMTGEPVENPVAKVLREGVVVGLANHTILIAQDGRQLPIDDSGAPIRSHSGAIVGVVLVFRDVSERRQQEQKLEEAHDFLASSVDALSAHIAVLDEAGIILMVNQAWRTFARANGVVGTDHGVGTDYFHACGPSEGTQAAQGIRDVLAERVGTFELEYPCHSPTEQRWFLMRVTRFRTSGQVRAVVAHENITSRKLAELAALRGEERLKVALAGAEAERRLLDTVLEALPVGVIVAEPSGKLVRMNRANNELWGNPPSSQSIDEYQEWVAYWPETGERIKAHEWAMARALTTGEHVPGELIEIERFDGSGRRLMINTAAPVKDAEGRIVAGVIAQLDVTERVRAERALRESEARFRQIADTMPQIVWVTRPDGYREYYNRRWYDYIGCAPAECLGDGWSTWLHPDDRSRTLERWSHSLDTGEDFQVEYRFRSKDGGYRWFLGRALPVRDEAGEIVKWFGTCTDVEDFKRVEADRHRFVSLVENSTDFISMFNPEGVPFYVNRAGLEMLGLRSLEEACRTPVEQYFFAEDRARVRDEFLPSVIKDGSGELEVRFRHFKTGSPLWMMYSVFTLTDLEGRRVGLATVSREITQRRQLEDNLRQLAADLSEADRRKDEFLATLAHELRNPLAPIRNGLQILKRAGSTGYVIEQARTMMDRQLAQMVRLVDDLLDVSRITRNKLELRREPTELSTVVNSAVESSRPLIEKMGHELIVSLPSEPITLYADLTRLAQVLMNLLNNAAKYSERGGRIWLKAELLGDKVEVSVKDTGIGLDADQLPRIFDMFSQVDASLEKAQGGLGIGLTLVRRLVEMHDGEVEAHSEGRGKGSEFVIRLPVSTASGAPSEESVTEAAPQSSLRILIVDDNKDGADSLAMILKIMGNEIRTAYDGQEGVDVAETYRPEVILLDIGLPRLNGYEACQHIRKQSWGHDVVLIAVTGWGQDEDRRRSREAGFDHHLVKPVDPEALMKLLAELGSRRE